MQWKEGIIAVKKNKEWYLTEKNIIRHIEKKDESIVEAVEQGICEDKELIQYLARTQKKDEVIAGFLLAQFLVDYMDFIQVSQGNSMIEP